MECKFPGSTKEKCESHGSAMGVRWERYYGSEGVDTPMAEDAYPRIH